MQKTVQMHMKELEPKRRAPKSTKYRNSLDRQTFVCIEVLFQLAVFFLSMQEIVSSHIFLAVFFHSTKVAMQFCLLTGSGVVIPPKVLLFLANQILQAIAMSLLVSARLGDDNAVFISICGIVGNCNRVQN